MDSAISGRSQSALSAFLAGFQAGMIAVCWMLAWMGVSAVWQRRGFWASENLMASIFYGDAAIRRGFAFSTVSGLALYLILYSLLGGFFALSVRICLSGFVTFLAAILFGLGWYYLWFHVIGKTAMPLVALLHSERPTVFGHLIYGGLLSRFHRFEPLNEQPVTGTIQTTATGGPPEPEP